MSDPEGTNGQLLANALLRAEIAEHEWDEICEELGCIKEPGVALRFVKGLRADLSRASKRETELLKSWDTANLTERQELDRLRRGWGPSTPTTHMKRWRDVRDCMTKIQDVYELCDVPEDSDDAETLNRVCGALLDAIGFCSERINEITVRPDDKFDLSFTEGLTAMREMIASFVENGGDTPCKTLAQSIRLNWNPSWGADPSLPLQGDTDL